MHTDYAPGHLAIFQELPKSYPGELTCHFSTAAVFLPLQHHSIATSLAPCLQIKIPLHGKDDRHAYLWSDTVRVGIGVR